MSVLKEQDFAVSDKLERVMEDILAVMKKLDLSIDYLASSVTGQDPFEIGLSQSALGRMVGKARGGQLKENKKMKITKLQLRNIIQEVLDEVEFHGETPAGQLYDTEEEDARFSMHLEVEKELEQRPEVAAVFKAAKLDYDEMGYMLKAMVKDTPEAKNFWDTPAYEKLYRYLEQEHIPYEIISQSREHAQTGPAKWILGYLRGDELDQKSRNIMGMPEALPPQYGGWAGIGSKRHPPGPGTSKRFRRESLTREKITKKELQKIIKEELENFLETNESPSREECEGLLGASGGYKPENPRELETMQRCKDTHPDLGKGKRE